MMFLKLAEKNREVVPQSWDKLYGFIVETELHKTHSPSEIEAIINNYLAEPDNPKYVEEFMILQERRKECKRLAKELMEVNE